MVILTRFFSSVLCTVMYEIAYVDILVQLKIMVVMCICVFEGKIELSVGLKGITQTA